MPALIDKRLIFVAGKGGVGRTTVAAALGLAAAARGRRTIVCEVARQERVSRAFKREGVGFHEVEQTIDAVLHDNLRLAYRFTSPLREGEGAARAIELCLFIKIVDIKCVGMLVEEVHARRFKDRFGLLLRHAVGGGNQATDGVELVADFLPFAQGVHGELALIREQPGKNGRRIPVAPDDSLQDAVTQLDHGARHGPEVHAPVARFFAHEQPVFVR